MIIVGRDVIWNDAQTSIPNVFYLSPRLTCKKLSFAASCYGMSYEESEEDRAYVREALKDFAYLGTRDEATEQYVKQIDCSLTTNHNCDPTLLLPLQDLQPDTEAVKSKLITYGIDLERPVIGVMGNAAVGKLAREVCGENAQLVGLYYENNFCNVSILDLAPSEWAIIFKFFTVTFTSFFHGTIFSLKNGIPTITVEQNAGYAKDYKTKTKDLLCRLGLEEYYIEPEKQTTDHVKAVYHTFLTHDQNARIEKSIREEAEYAESFFSALKTVSVEVEHGAANA